MLQFDYHKRVRYAETDKMGYLYYGHYAMLYEIGRAEMIRDLGISYHQMEEELHIMMPVLSLQCRYRLPAKYDDLLTIRTKLIEKPTKMITFHHEIYNEQHDLLNTGEVKLFFVDMKTNRRVSAPLYLSSKLESFF
jgi:acyl-CoA thioester hydrolase